MLIIASKNYKSGDYIELEGAAGSIDSVDLIYTTVNSTDNKRIIIPNSVLAGNIVTNYSHNELRRVDMNFSIGYSDDILKAKEIIRDIYFYMNQQVKLAFDREGVTIPFNQLDVNLHSPEQK